jgi:membrane protease YdiL (CAAX protease family)
MPGEKRLNLSEAVLCSLGLMVFSFFIHYNFPVKLISFAALLISAMIISRNLRSFSDLKKITGENISGSLIIYTIAGFSAGLGLAVIYRRHLEVSLIPESVHLFFIVAALIGAIEEVVFRGFLQAHVKSINGPFSVLFSTLAHTGYKCCLFLSPVIISDIDVGFLALWTFCAGLFFGTIRHLSNSIMPPLAAHVFFDILVYAEFTNAPWWVW